jgi:hypothetical protein
MNENILYILSIIAVPIYINIQCNKRVCPVLYINSVDMKIRFSRPRSTIYSRYYDTDGIRKMYQYTQTIDITILNFYCLGMVGIQIWYRNKQYFVIIEIVTMRVYCITITSFTMHCRYGQ